MTRLRLALLTLFLAALAATGLVAAQSSTATVVPGANFYHPYSDPLWFPFRSEAIRIGCAGSSTLNNSSLHCKNDHPGYYAINFAVPLYSVYPQKANPHPKVFSVGAGVVRKVVTGQSCTHGSTVLPGNLVMVDNGGGLVAEYDHLATVSVKVGDYITALTSIGTAGATGDFCGSDGKPGPSYLNFKVRHWGGYATLTYPTPQLRACSNGKAVGWPSALPLAKYSYLRPSTVPQVWNQVPWGAQIQLDPADFSCIPSTGGAGSPSEMTGIHASRTSSSSHSLTWTAVSGVNSYTMELQVLKGSTWSVPCSPFVTPGCTYGFLAIPSTSTHLTISGAGKYRVRLSAHNGVGWSRASDWLTLP